MWPKFKIQKSCLSFSGKWAAVFLGRARKLTTDRRGNILVTSALALPIVVMVVGAVLDHALVISQESDLQAAVDAAAISTAQEMSLSDANATRLTASAQAAVAYNLTGGTGQSALNVSIEIDQNNMTVTVKAEQKVEQLFSGMIFDVSSVTASAQAQVVGTVRVCAIGLEPRRAGAIALNDSARMTGNGCAIFANSSSANGILSKGRSIIEASLICSAGGYIGGAGNFTPEPLTDCPPFEDPLAGRQEPRTGPCIADELEINTGRVTLSPGTYCDGLKIGGDAIVTLLPGIYVMKNGPLMVKNEAELFGQYVGFYFTGEDSTLLFEVNTVIDLEAPKDGLMAGILMFESRSGNSREKHEIFSNNARNLLGTIYFPRGTFYVDANAPIADQSDYTVIIANRIELYSGLELVLNTNYGDTDIPVPSGIQGRTQNVILTQ